MGQIFISYSHKDKDYAHKLQQNLFERGFDAWIDDRIDYGVDWPNEIEARLKECDAFILVMTPAAKASHWVQTELLHAIELGKAIFPLQLDGDIWWSVRRMQALGVQGGTLPPLEFYTRLAEVAPRSVTGKRRPEPAPAPQPNVIHIHGNVAHSNITVGDNNQIQSPHNAPVERPSLNPEPDPDPVSTPVKHLIRSMAKKPGGANIQAPSSVDVPSDMPKAPVTMVDASSILSKTPASSPRPRPNTTMLVTIGLIVFGVLILGGLLWLNLSNSPAAPKRTMTPTASITSVLTATTEPTITARPTVTSEPSATPLPLTIIDNGAKMVLIPAGPFIMGSDNDYDYEKPAHTVDWPTFYMDVYEVTNALYKVCMNAGKCQPPKYLSSATHKDYYSNPEYDEYPVIYVDWNMATTYCKWRSLSTYLPSEAEWEKASRGIDGRIYPWGNEIDPTRANYFNTKIDDTAIVGGYKSGKSPYGVYDMAGNVWEWVNDWYDVYPGGNKDASTSFGQKYRVLRGGAWNEIGFHLRSASRYWFGPSSTNYLIGFRCARSIQP